MDSLVQDLRYALRALGKSRGVSLVAVLTLAVGMGAVTTFFSLVNSALLKPVPYPDPGRLVALSAERSRRFPEFSKLTLDAVNEIRRSVRSFERVGAFREVPVRVRLADDVSLYRTTELDADLLPLLGVRPQLGRAFTETEVRAHDALVILSDSLWRSELGGSAGVLGRAIRIDGVDHVVIGVMPPGFRFYERSDMWIPLRRDPVAVGSTLDPSYSAIGRLRRGASLARARTEVGLVGQRLAAANAASYGGWSHVVRDGIVDRGARAWGSFAILFVGAGVFVLLVACSNVANLLLARATERRTEMAIRASLGASRARLLRQSLTESLLLALAAAAVGTVLAVWGVQLLTSVVPTANFPSWVRFGIDVRVLGFAFVLALTTVLGFGLVPALEGTRIDLTDALKFGTAQAGRAMTATRRGRGIIVTEIALSLVLFVGAVLLARTYHNLSRIDIGYDASRVLSPFLALDPARYGDSRRREQFVTDVAERLEANPGVAGVATRGTFAAPTDTADTTGRAGAVAGAAAYLDHALYLPNDLTTPASLGASSAPDNHVVSDDYFEVLGLSITRGRGFASQDQSGSAPVVLVSERIARQLWPDRNPLGAVLQVGRHGVPRTVVGVVSNVTNAGLSGRGVRAEQRPDVYLSVRQADRFTAELLIRARTDPGSLHGAIREAVRAVDREQSAPRIRTLAEASAGGMSALRLVGQIMAAFAVCALGLALIGIYGVISYSVAHRSREIGIRMALGADANAAVRLVLRDGGKLTLIGIGFGLAAAAALSQVLARLLWGVSPFNVVTYLSVALVFGAVALLACYVPARRVARVEPLVALRGP